MLVYLGFLLDFEHQAELLAINRALADLDLAIDTPGDRVDTVRALHPDRPLPAQFLYSLDAKHHSFRWK